MKIYLLEREKRNFLLLFTRILEPELELNQDQKVLYVLTGSEIERESLIMIFQEP